ncbi:MAG: hypothetical protein CMJ78_25825 [Planctomycetaceae bacterium]|nr:hypothetical protein [Planctomycetaceae bacterium]
MDWLNAFLFFLLIAGHTEFQVAIVVNRSHAIPLPCGFLRQLRHVHDVLVPAFPLVLIWFLGIKGPRLLLGGSWSDVGWSWRVYLAICAVSCVALILTTIARRLRRDPACLIASESQVVNIEKELGARPVGAGPYQGLANLSINEMFQLEYTQKTFELRGLPNELDGLTIMHLSDWHFIGTLDLPYFQYVTDIVTKAESDLIVFTGDLLDDQRLIDWIEPTLGQMSAPFGCYFILGNHDWYLQPEKTRERFEQLGWHDVSGTVKLVDTKGHPLAIGGDERPWMGEAPDFSIAPENSMRLLLSHSPDNIKWAKRNAIDLMLAGHNHGGQVRLPIIEAVYSPSIYGCRYASGVFFEEPTLLYISRGISGRHPLRWRCLPEITRLTLRSPTAHQTR